MKRYFILSLCLILSTTNTLFAQTQDKPNSKEVESKIQDFAKQYQADYNNLGPLGTDYQNTVKSACEAYDASNYDKASQILLRTPKQLELIAKNNLGYAWAEAAFIPTVEFLADSYFLTDSYHKAEPLYGQTIVKLAKQVTTNTDAPDPKFDPNNPSSDDIIKAFNSVLPVPLKNPTSTAGIVETGKDFELSSNNLSADQCVETFNSIVQHVIEPIKTYKYANNYKSEVITEASEDLLNLAIICDLQHKHAEADKLFNAYKSNISHYNFWSSAKQLNAYAEAVRPSSLPSTESIYKTALNIAKNDLGKNHTGMATRYELLAAYYAIKIKKCHDDSEKNDLQSKMTEAFSAAKETCEKNKEEIPADITTLINNANAPTFSQKKIQSKN